VQVTNSLRQCGFGQPYSQDHQVLHSRRLLQLPWEMTQPRNENKSKNSRALNLIAHGGFPPRCSSATACSEGKSGCRINHRTGPRRRYQSKVNLVKICDPQSRVAGGVSGAYKARKNWEPGSGTGLPALKGADFLRPPIDAKLKAKEIMPSWPYSWAVASAVPS
jgi:hypothetical protein